MLFISRRDRLNWGMIHASNLCLLFLYCQWLMRGNCKSSQKEALLQKNRRIGEGASEVVLQFRGFSSHCWSVHGLPKLLLSELNVISKSQKLLRWINTCSSTLALAAGQSWHHQVKVQPLLVSWENMQDWGPQKSLEVASHFPALWSRSHFIPVFLI